VLSTECLCNEVEITQLQEYASSSGREYSNFRAGRELSMPGEKYRYNKMSRIQLAFCKVFYPPQLGHCSAIIRNAEVASLAHPCRVVMTRCAKLPRTCIRILTIVINCSFKTGFCSGQPNIYVSWGSPLRAYCVYITKSYQSRQKIQVNGTRITSYQENSWARGARC